MKKRVLSMLMALVMLITMLPTTALASHSHCVCGGSVTVGGHTHENITSWVAWDGTDKDNVTQGDQLTAGSYYLTGNVGVNSVTIVGTVNLCLNGHTITTTNSYGAFYVKSGAILNICDCSTTQPGEIKNTSASDNYPGIYNNGGTVNVYGGTVSGADTGIRNNGGTVNVYGGTVSGADTGIKNEQNSNLNIYNGTAEAATGGTGYGVYNQGTVSVSGGIVTGKSNGIRNYYTGTINVSGTVQVSGSTGIYNDGGTFTVSGGTVTATGSSGAGIHNTSTGTLTVSGGTVTANNGSSKGISNSGTLNLQGAPSITGAAADIYLNSGKLITIGENGLTYTSDKAISVKMETPGTFTTSWNTYMSSADSSDYFTSANDGYTVQPDGNELKLAVPHTHGGWTYSYAANGNGYGIITAKCGNEGCPLNGGAGTATCNVTIHSDFEYKYVDYACPVIVEDLAPGSDWVQAGLAKPTVKNYRLTEEPLKGTATITVDDEEACSVPFTLQKGTLTAADITLILPDDMIYSGSAKEVTFSTWGDATHLVTIYYEGEGLVDGKPVNAGTYTVKVNVAGSEWYNAVNGLNIGSFDIAPKDITAADVTFEAIPDQYYTGYEVQPKPVIQYNGMTLVEDIDYVINAYHDNKEIGTNIASVTISGKGNYYHSKTVNFNITYEPKEAGEVLTWNDGGDGWFDIDIHNKPIFTPKEGYTVSLTADGTYGKSALDFSDDEEGENISKTVYVKDGEGKIYQVTLHYKYDKTEPTFSVSEAETPEWSNVSKNIVVTVTSETLSGVKSVELYLGDVKQDVAFELVDGRYLGAVTANGNYKVKVTDNAGNYGFQNTRVSGIDKTEPSASVSVSGTAGENGWYTSDVTVTISKAEDTDSGLAAEPYSFDGGQTWQSASTKTYTETTENVVVYIRDNAGNKTGPFVLNINIDKDSPTIDSASGNPTEWTKDDVTLTVNASDGAAGLAAEAYSFDGGQTWQAENTKTYTANTADIVIKVRDAAGNISTFDALSIAMIDKVRPDITHWSISGNAEEWNTSNVSSTVSVSDDKAISKWQYSIDGGESWSNGNGTDGGEFMVIGDGIHRVMVKAIDQAGNEAVSEAREIKIDTTEPSDVTVTAKAGEKNYTSGTESRGDVVFTLSATDATSGIGKYQVKIDNADWVDLDGSTYTHSGKTDADGVSYQFRAVDHAGNTGEASDAVVVVNLAHTHAICGALDCAHDTNSETDGAQTHASAIFTEVNELPATLERGKTYYFVLTEDMDAWEPTVTGDGNAPIVYICLNGHTIESVTLEGNWMQVHFCDCAATAGTIGTLTIVDSGDSWNYGVAIGTLRVSDSTDSRIAHTMIGGVVTGNAVIENGTFRMEGGEIKGNLILTNCSGGLYGGVIHGDLAIDNGQIWAYGTKEFNFGGFTIKGNVTVAEGSGGVNLIVMGAELQGILTNGGTVMVLDSTISSKVVNSGTLLVGDMQGFSDRYPELADGVIAGDLTNQGTLMLCKKGVVLGRLDMYERDGDDNPIIEIAESFTQPEQPIQIVLYDGDIFTNGWPDGAVIADWFDLLNEGYIIREKDGELHIRQDTVSIDFVLPEIADMQKGYTEASSGVLKLINNGTYPVTILDVKFKVDIHGEETTDMVIKSGSFPFDMEVDDTNTSIVIAANDGLPEGEYTVWVCVDYITKGGQEAAPMGIMNTVTFNVEARPLTGTVTVTGTAEVGQTLTASVTDTNNTGTLTYQWFRHVEDSVLIEGATGSTYQITEDDVQQMIYCVVSSSVEDGGIESNRVGPVALMEFPDGSVSVKGYTGKYDGNAHGITVTVPEGASVYYSTDAENYHIGACPTYTEVGEYTVYYRVYRFGYHTISGSEKVVITEPEPETFTITFDPANGEAAFTKGYVAGRGYALPAAPEKNGYTFAGWKLGSGAIYQAGESFTATADATFTAQWTKNEPDVLTGTVQIIGTAEVGRTLTVAVTDTNNTGTLTYQWYRHAEGSIAIERATGSTYVVTEKDIGQVLYCVVTSSVQTGSITSNRTDSVPLINFAEGSITAEGYTGKYDGKAHGIIVTAPEGAKVEFGVSNEDYSLNASPKFTDIGTYTVYFKVSKPGYNSYYGNAEVVITENLQTIVVSMSDYVYGGAVATPVVSGSFTGAVSYFYSTDSTNVSIPWQNMTATGLNVGTYYMIAKAAPTEVSPEATSAVISFRVLPGKYTVPAAPSVNDFTVTIQEADRNKKLEYSMDGVNWVNVPVLWNGSFTLDGLKDNTGYRIYLRVKASADGNYLASDAVSSEFTTPGKYSVAYNANEGRGSIPASTQQYTGSYVTVASADGLSRKGYVFVGWNTAPDGSGTAYRPGDQIGSGATLYAQWSKNTYTVKFMSNGGSGSMDDMLFAYDVQQALSLNKFTREGYHFAGWATGSGKNVLYTDGQVVMNLAAHGTVTLHAVWVEDLYGIDVFVKSDSPAFATVTVMRGNSQIGETLRIDMAAQGTTFAGQAHFGDMPKGIYNIIVEQDGKTMTKQIIITDHDDTLNVEMPVSNVNSVLEIKGEDTHAVVVGGLDQEAATKAEENKAVTITMTVEKTEEKHLAETATEEEKRTQEAIADIIVVADAPSDQIEFLEITVEKTVEEGNQQQSVEKVAQTNTVMEIIIPFDLTDKSDIAVYRYHDGLTETLQENRSKKDGTYYVDWDAHLIHVFASKFSTYAIGYSSTEPEPPVTPEPPIVYPEIHACFSKCPVCGGCLDGYCAENVCMNKCILPMTFTDVKSGMWYTDAVEYVYHRGMMQGVGNNLFGIDATTTRAMLVTILWRLEGCPVVNYLMQFEDIAYETWYTEAIRWAASEKIVSGYSTTSFGPMDEITREQLASILYRYEQYKGGGFKGLWMFRMDYVDLADVSDWAYEAMCWMTMNNVISGLPGKILDPKGTATRAQLASMLYRYCQEEE